MTQRCAENFVPEDELLNSIENLCRFTAEDTRDHGGLHYSAIDYCLSSFQDRFPKLIVFNHDVLQHGHRGRPSINMNEVRVGIIRRPQWSSILIPVKCPEHVYAISIDRQSLTIVIIDLYKKERQSF